MSENQSDNQQNDLLLNAEKDEKNPLKRVFYFQITAAELEEGLLQLARQYQPKIKLDGFRQGRVPLEIVRQQFFPQLEKEFLEEKIDKLVNEEIKKQQLQIVTYPHIRKLEKNDQGGWDAEVEIEIYPQIELPELGSIEIEIASADLKKEQFDAEKEIEKLLSAQKVPQPVSGRGVIKGDYVILKEQHRLVGEKKLSPRRQFFLIVDEENSCRQEIKDLLPEILGKAAGTRINFRRDYPRDYPKKIWADKTVEFEVEISAIYELKQPELNDKLLASLQVKSKEELLQKLERDYELREKTRIQNLKVNAFFEQLISKINFPVPERLQNVELSRLFKEHYQRLQQLHPDEQKGEFEKLKTISAKNVRTFLLNDELIKKYSLELKPEEFEEELKKIATEHNVSLVDVRRYYSQESRRQEFENHLQEKKVVDFILERIKIKEV